MLEFIRNLLNFNNGKAIFPPRKSKINQQLDEITSLPDSELENYVDSATSISGGDDSYLENMSESSSSQLNTEAELYELSDFSETSVSSEGDIESEDNLESETDMDNVLNTDEISETSYATITELSGGYNETSFVNVKQQKKSYNQVLDSVILDLENILKQQI